MALTVVGMMQLPEVLPKQVGVAVAIIGRAQPDATMATPEAPVRPTPSAALVTVFGMGQLYGDMAEGSASLPLTPSIVGGSVPAGTSQRGGLAAIGAGGEPSLALMSVGSDSPTRGEPLL